MRERLVKEEGGFTLTEVLVTMMMMTLVMFALYSIFDMSIRVFSFGNDKVEAVENARIGLSKMEREIRAAYPEDKANKKATLTCAPSSPTPSTALLCDGSDNDTIIFGLDLNGNHVVDSGEKVYYNLSGSTLMRNGNPAIEYVREVDQSDGDETPLTFEYQNRFGNTTSVSSAEIVKIKLEIDTNENQEGGTQILQTDVSLRNRNT